MEMKHEQNHMSVKCSNHGFTLIELMIALVVSLLALGAIYSTFQSQNKSYQVQEETADMHQNIRAAMYYMQREIRMAGCDPLNVGSIGIKTANHNSITFTEDVRGNNPSDPPDGDTTDPGEDITYSLDANNNLVRTDNIVDPGNPQVVARNINALNFVYWGNASPPNVLNAGTSDVTPGTENQIRAVEITIVARTTDPLLYGTRNNRQYLNQQGTEIYDAPGDNVSRRLLTSYIKCRNLGL